MNDKVNNTNWIKERQKTIYVLKTNHNICFKDIVRDKYIIFVSVKTE